MSDMQGWGTGQAPDPDSQPAADLPPPYTPPAALVDPSGRYEIYGGYPLAENFEQDGSQFRQPARSWTRLAPPTTLTVAVSGDRISIRSNDGSDVLASSFEGQLDMTRSEFGFVSAAGTYEGLAQGWSDQNSDVFAFVDAVEGSGQARVEFQSDSSWHTNRGYAEAQPIEPGLAVQWPTSLDEPPVVLSYPIPNSFVEPGLAVGGVRMYVRTAG